MKDPVNYKQQLKDILGRIEETKEASPKVADFYFNYFSYNMPSVCHVRVIISSDQSPIVLLSEISNNPGPSVTNTARELIAALGRTLPAVMTRLGVAKDTPVRYVEHYNQRVVYTEPDEESQTYDLLTVDDTGKRVWRHLGCTPGEAATRLGCSSKVLDVPDHILSD